MERLHVVNSLTRQKELFEPLTEGRVGLYVCGPTVYGDPHLGHARSAITFDVVFRYLQHLGYKVRYVRNVTDVGHLENDGDSGEDKIAKQARLEQIEPMEVAQHYLDRYHFFMDALNVRRPSIEPRATGHIPEQIALVERILANGFAYEVNGSVYFDLPKYLQEVGKYGQLSGRTDPEELLAGSREDLAGQSEKRHPADFALWKAADERHIMRWSSPWGEGFPGWHLECTAMSTKYLGPLFDIHGGGMDLKFPHHEGEIAQSNACHHPHGPYNEARYWLHNNMLTIDGQKMGKSLGNFITLEQLFAGDHVLLAQAFSPMTVRFFTLQAHYRSTLDFSSEALLAAEKGLHRLLNGIALAGKLHPQPVTTVTQALAKLRAELYGALNDDFNTGIAIAALFEGVKLVHALDTGTEKATADDLETLRKLLQDFAFEVLGLQPEADPQAGKLDAALQVLVELRMDARRNKDFAQADRIRDALAEAGIQLHDGPKGTTWSV